MTIKDLPSHLSPNAAKKSFTFHKAGLASIVLLSALVATGCNKSDKGSSDANGNDGISIEESNESEQVNLEAVGPNAKEYCTDEKLKAVVQQAVETSIGEQAESNAKVRSERSTLRFNATNASAKVKNLIVDVNGIKAAAQQSGGIIVTCEATLNVSVPQRDLNKAQTRYTYNKKSSLNERVTAANLTLNEKKLTETITFSIEAQSAVPVVTTADVKVIGVVSDVLAASATQDRKNVIVAAARKKAEQARKEKARRAEQARKEKARRAEQARKEKAQRVSQPKPKPKPPTPQAARNTSSAPINRGSNTSIESMPKVSDVAPPALKVPDAEKVQLKITQGEDTY